MKKFFIYLVVFIFLFFTIQRLVVPKYAVNLVEGSMTSEYYEEESSHQIIFIGDCEVYSNFSPITLFNNYGYTSYIRGNSQQLIWQSYHLLRETFEFEKPEIVIFNVNSLRYDEKVSEAYNRLMIDKMKNSAIKYDLIKDSMLEEESLIDYVFPIFRYHSRVLDLTLEDFKYYFSDKKITHNGYLMRVDIKGATTNYKGKPLANYDFSGTNLNYLDNIRELCEENDVELILIKAPSLYPYWYNEYEEQIEDYSEKYDISYLNFLELSEIEIDYSNDTYDSGLHLNLSGAEKLSDYLGGYLKENYDLDDMRKDEKINKIYEEKTNYYNEMKKQQYYELEKYGKIVMYGG